jgi:hypothetical protein
MAPKPTAVLYKCADDAAYLATGRGVVALPPPPAPAAAVVHALLLVEAAGPGSALTIAGTARAGGPAPAPVPAVEPAVMVDPPAPMAPEPAPVRALSEPGDSAPVTGPGCGGDGQPACETEAEKKAEEKVQEGEANFALAVAFFGCIAIVRAANKYARDPS